MAALALPAPAAARDPAPPRPRGPFEAREEWLLGQNRLSLPSTTPDALAPRETRLRLDLDWGNDFGWSQPIAGEVSAQRASWWTASIPRWAWSSGEAFAGA